MFKYEVGGNVFTVTNENNLYQARFNDVVIIETDNFEMAREVALGQAVGLYKVGS
jgi:hypothetical protein